MTRLVVPPDEKFRHSVPIQVRFNDLDLLGHVTNAVYQVYYSQGGVSYIDRVLLGWGGDVNFIMASIAIEYYKPVMLACRIAVQVRAAALGRKSFQFISRIVDLDSDDIYSRCQYREVCYSRVEKKSIPIPVMWRERILAYEFTPPLEESQAGRL
ncbi:MAG: thioesterase family protein [Desulfarculales bacterium]|jgi:acyl-CoA thioester hydrolase|nr:thioesterase family protein [Desulfarculales bacterium]